MVNKEDKLKITNISDLQKFNEGEIVELPSFDDSTPFVAKLKRPSLLALCKGGQIPNTLLGSAQELFEGRQKSDIKKYAEILDVVLTAAMVEPQYSEVAEVLTDMQKLAIFAFAQGGVASLHPFREIERIQKNSGVIKE